MKKILLLIICLLIQVNTCIAKDRDVEYVSFNPGTKVYHSISCPSAKVCKKCIVIEKETAIKRGGRACQRCGGRQ